MSELFDIPVVYIHQLPIKAGPPSKGFPYGTPLTGYSLFAKECAKAKLLHYEESKSPVKMFIDCANHQWADNLGSMSNVPDTGGVLRTVSSFYFRCNGAMGDASQGIVVGTGGSAISAVIMSGHCLAIKILHGTTTGKLYYEDTQVVSGTYHASGAQSALTRVLWNLGGGNIDIAETGLYCFDGSSYYFMHVRDALSSPVTFVSGGAYAVTYFHSYS